MQDDHINKKKLSLIKNLYKDIEETKGIDKENALNEIQQKIRVKSRKQLFISTFQRVASVLLIPFILTTLYFAFRTNPGSFEIKDLYTEVIALPGTIIQTQLPDQSTVWLNSGSRLRYPQRFSGDRREVELIGEGFFDVVTNDLIPFEVSLDQGIKLTARGTSFNIKAFPGDLSYEIILKEGVVDVFNTKFLHTLQPDQMLSYNTISHEVNMIPVDTNEKTIWTNGYMIFRNTPLDEVVKQLSRRYDVDIRYEAKELHDYRIRGTYLSETVYQILDYLTLATPIEWSVADNENNKNSDKTIIRIMLK